MKAFLPLTVFIFLVSLNAVAQGKPHDKIETSAGTLVVQPVEHATFVLTLGNKNIYVDPTGGAASFTGYGAPDLILVSDIHGDHFDSATIAVIRRPNTVIVAPQAVADRFPVAARNNLVVLGNGASTQQQGVSIKAIPMYNLPQDPNAFHTKGRGNGYVLGIGGKNIYISGDTEDIPEMRALTQIDAAFICMNVPFTMDINQAASGVLAFKPKVVFPYHYRGQNGLSDVKGFRKLVHSGNKNIAVRLLKWYPGKE